MNNKDPYNILGVAKSATQDEIRKAYRARAKELHPDLNPGNATAADRFKEVSTAYHLLRDPEKRARYDRGEIDASGADRPQQNFYREYADTGRAGAYRSSAGFEDFADVSDLFGDLFGERAGPAGRQGERRFRARGQDIRYRLEVDFLDAVKGAKRRVTLPDGKALDLTIPEGVADGQVLRLQGKGMPGLGEGPPGDALVEIAVKPHLFFERQGDDIVVELPITLDEAVTGAKVETPTVSGRVALTLPKGTSSGRVLRLRGKGVKKRSGGHGDQLVRLKIVLPPTIDAELEDFMKSWRERHGYDPRAEMRATS